ncbi:MAG TPA: 30S ribosomal protein S16 [Firmicutes bacterium]|nr:30S ribosomal protein S16 [Bacillota bacterium]
MAVRIRLRRMGAKKRPYYRLVVADSRVPRDGSYIEAIGSYDPMTEPAVIKVDVEKALLWLSRGAQPSDSARQVLEKAGVLEKYKSGTAAGSGEEGEQNGALAGAGAQDGGTN